MGSFTAGTKLDFWLLANGFNNPDPLYPYGADPALNPDGLEHLVAWEYENYVVLGFEDLYGPLGATDPPNQNSDRDFNDVVFVLDLPLLKEKPASTPEPASTLGFLVLAIMGLYSRLKTRRS
ncbi:MAG: DUF4114 domain-containing protein [Okeania sp. SIO2F4]|uniref:DUF4114 domain-containing protein n=1 Tax=Okeania sp. SIO2F4 TaxID=2607790 RepID=UPI001429C524|nr:DUF4114 domain-containing protein [Okeania sp. SIO2F4]NES01838.1 DUF4114 domain-containing protein [Okeania sp. SIO2F4]